MFPVDSLSKSALLFAVTHRRLPEFQKFLSRLLLNPKSLVTLLHFCQNLLPVEWNVIPREMFETVIVVLIMHVPL
jgi:hypothetical protein